MFAAFFAEVKQLSAQKKLGPIFGKDRNGSEIKIFQSNFSWSFPYFLHRTIINVHFLLAHVILKVLWLHFDQSFFSSFFICPPPKIYSWIFDGD